LIRRGTPEEAGAVARRTDLWRGFPPHPVVRYAKQL
jgi:hypothetical protein